MWVICYPHSTALSVKKALVLMPVLWVVAFCMSYPQVYYKELVTVSTNKFVVIHTNFPMSEWIGKLNTIIIFGETEFFI